MLQLDSWFTQGFASCCSALALLLLSSILAVVCVCVGGFASIWQLARPVSTNFGSCSLTWCLALSRFCCFFMSSCPHADDEVLLRSALFKIGTFPLHGTSLFKSVRPGWCETLSYHRSPDIHRLMLPNIVGNGLVYLAT